MRHRLKTLSMPPLSLFQQLILSLVKQLCARKIVLIGGGNIAHAEMLLQYVESVDGELVGIDPNIANDDLKKILESSVNGKFSCENSRTALSSIQAADLYIIDGDHNYYTVKEELESSWKLNEKAQKPFMAIVRGVHWPFGHRDAYFVPESIPAEFRHPFTWTEGVTIDNPGITQEGLRFDDMAFANVEGGPRNGVSTAIVDFLEDRKKSIKFTIISGLSGFGFLYSAHAPWTLEATNILEQFHNNPLLEAMEQNRLDLLLQACKFENEVVWENIHRQNGSFGTEQFSQAIREGKGKKSGLGLVSIIMPTLNRESLLEWAITSVLNQTYQEIELVVINDGGRTVRPLIESFKDERIVCLEHKERKGLPGARNTGIKQAKGEYIAYLDDDDLYYPMHIEVLINAIHASGCLVAYSDTFFVHRRENNGQFIKTHRTLRSSIDIDRQSILVSSEFPPVSICHAKSCLERVGIFDETLKRYEDWDLWIRLAQEFDFLHIPIPTTEYVTTEGYHQMITAWAGFFLDALLVIHHRYKHLVKGVPVLQAEQAAFRNRSMYRSYKQLEKIDVDQFYKFKLGETMNNIIQHSFLHTIEDVRGAYALLAYMVERFPDIVELPALFARFDQHSLTLD